VSTTTAAELGQSPTISTAAISAATTFQRCSYSTAAAGYHQAATAIPHQQLSMHQLWEDGPLCSRMLPTKAKQLTASSGTHGHPTGGHQKGPAPWTGHANYTTMEEIPTREEVLASTFFLNECSIIIQFDSGTSRDFMSFTFAKKAKLSLVASGAP
jgi:hypothetical protein